ncbi:MAG: endonuclease domain-containing protein [Bacteroidota bacterium]
MSLMKSRELILVAKEVGRELRRHSTKAEDLLWEQLRNRRFMNMKWRRQHPLFHDLLGREIFYVPDFYCHEVKLAVEVDGEIHKKRYQYDQLRDEVINALGIAVVRFTNEQVENDMAGALSVLGRAAEKFSSGFLPFSSQEKGLGDEVTQ